jgi:hypothetical protein
VIDECQVVKCITGTVSVLLGNGDGTFQAAGNYGSGGNTPASVAIGDLNGDGKLDLAVVNAGESAAIVSILLGNGDGTFGAPVSYSAGGTSAGIGQLVAIGDVNGDGKADLVVSNTDSANVGVLLGNGDGTFQSPVDYIAGGTYTGSVAVADLNGGGKLDIVVNVSCPNSGGCQGNGSSGGVSVLLGNGDGTFRGAVIYPSGGDFPNSLAIGDLNGDGIPDLGVSNFSSSDPNGIIGVLLGNGDGTFEAAVDYSTGGSGAGSLAVGDMNGDGHPDLVAVTGAGTACREKYSLGFGVLLGKGDGTFGSGLTRCATGDGPGGLAVADVSGDGRPDVLIVSCSAPGDNSCPDGDGIVSVVLNILDVQTTTSVSSTPNPSKVKQ